MAADKQNLQDAFLNHVRKAKVPVTIFLINGVKLQGMITWFDNFCVLLRRDGQSQLVYKHAISTVVPARNVRIGPSAGEEGAEESRDFKESDQHLVELHRRDVFLVDPELAVIFKVHHGVVQLGQRIAEALAAWTLVHRGGRVLVEAVNHVRAKVEPGHVGPHIVPHGTLVLATDKS